MNSIDKKAISRMLYSYKQRIGDLIDSEPDCEEILGILKNKNKSRRNIYLYISYLLTLQDIDKINRIICKNDMVDSLFLAIAESFGRNTVQYKALQDSLLRPELEQISNISKELQIALRKEEILSGE